MDDTARHSAPQQDMDGRRHTMSLSTVAADLQAAGVPRSHRHIVRLCKSGALDAGKYPGASGDEWFVAPNSIPKVIGDLHALDEARARRSALQHDTSIHVAVETAPKIDQDTARYSTPQHDVSREHPSDKTSETQPDLARHSTPDRDVGGEPDPAMSRYVTQLEKRIEEKDEVIGMLRGELANRNEEIVRRNERERETNILIRGLQNLVLQLQPGRGRAADVLEDDPMMDKREVEQPGA
jgi:hypothetical protein